MRIKTDFVINSSSTAFIVCIPRNFIPTKEEIDSAYSTHNIYRQDEDELTEEDLYKKLPYELMEDLKNGDNLWYYGNDGCDQRLFHMVAEICGFNGFVLISFEIEGEGNNRIQGIKEEELQKWFMNTQLQKLSIEVNK